MIFRKVLDIHDPVPQDITFDYLNTNKMSELAYGIRNPLKSSTNKVRLECDDKMLSVIGLKPKNKKSSPNVFIESGYCFNSF